MFGNSLDIGYRPDLTPELRRLFADRLSEERAEADLAENALTRPLSPFGGPRRLRTEKEARTTSEPRLCYRLKCPKWC